MGIIGLVILAIIIIFLRIILADWEEKDKWKR